MKLELKHLAPYLPYVLMINDGDGTTRALLPKDMAVRKMVDGVIDYSDHIKPILHPLSDLLLSKCFVEIETASESEMNEGMWSELKYRLERCEKHNSNIDVNRMPYWVIEILLKYHIDIFGLIKAKLAIDINTLKK